MERLPGLGGTAAARTEATERLVMDARPLDAMPSDDSVQSAAVV